MVSNLVSNKLGDWNNHKFDGPLELNFWNEDEPDPDHGTTQSIEMVGIPTSKQTDTVFAAACN